MNNRKLDSWNWKKNFNTLEEATEFLLDYTAELGPLSQACIDRLNKKEIKLQEITKENKSLKSKFKEDITNEKNKDRQI